MVVALGCQGDPDAGVRTEVRDVQAGTMPRGARLVSESPIARYTWGVKASWDVEVATSWDEYVEDVREGLVGFTSRPRASGSAEFVKTLPGDTYVVHIEPLGENAPLRARVWFSSLAR
jgi:hypothetical protein